MSNFTDQENLRTKCCLVYDFGLFAELAPRLARDFGQVLYYVPWEASFPKAAPSYVGMGLAKNVERVSSFWDRVPEADVVLMGEVCVSDVQKVVAERFYKPVFGHRGAERLELDRWGTRRLQKQLGIAAPPTKLITSVADLEKHLQTVEDKWIKISTFRGDAETWHHENWHTSSIKLDHFKNAVGALQNVYEFLVEDAIEGVEIGYDGWHVNGKFPEACYWGFEVKDEGYIGKFSPYSELPEPVRFINSKMAPILKNEGARGFCSFEFRLTRDGTPYLIDPCMRFASPPTEAFMEGYDNFSEIVWFGAQGMMVEPKSLGEYIAIALIHSPFALTNWVPIDIPDDIRRWVKIRNAAVIEGKLYHVPLGGDMPEIGAVVAVADGLDEAIRLVKERAKRVQGYEITPKVEALDAAQEEINKAKDYGIDF